MARKTRYPRTKAQREFRLKFWQETGIEFSDDTTVPFAERAHDQIVWYHEHTNDARLRLESALDGMTEEPPHAQ